MALVTNPVTIFLIVLVIILLAPVVLTRLRVPHIVGMIVAGIVVGPFGLHILARDSSFDIFGQVGLLYLMFLAGLEIDMYHLRLNMRRGAVFGTLTFLVPMAVGVAASVWVLHTGWLTAFLLASMYASHTLIAYPVAARYGVTKAPAVLMAIVGTIICVVGSLLVLAGAVNINAEGWFNPGILVWMGVKLALYCGGVLYAYPRVTRWFFKRYSDRVTQYVFTLAMVFLSAWVAGRAGLEPVLGAFLGGLVMNRYVPANSPLMSSIEFVGNALFIPYFLIGVGMMIDVGVILRGNTLWVAAVMLAAAIAGKWLPAWLTQKIYRMAPADRTMMFGLTTAHTAVALAVVTLGYNMFLPDGSRMMDETMLNGTILVILVTCAIAPIATSRAAAKIKIRLINEGDAAELPDAPAGSPAGGGSPAPAAVFPGPECILVPVSNPVTAASLAELALLMRPAGKSATRAGAPPLRMYSLHVRNDNSPQARAVGQNSLRLASSVAQAVGVPMEAIERYDLNTVTGLLNTLEERDVSMVVMGMHRKSTIIDSFLGSKVEQLLRGTNRMVVISRCYIPVNTLTRIVVVVPPKAQYETGFPRWVTALSSLTREVGCRVIFCAPEETHPLLRAIILREGLGIRHEYRPMESLDDFPLVAGHVLDDDLLVVVGARPNSVSHSSAVADLPALLQRNYSRNNIMMVFPSQFSSSLGADLPSFSNPLRQ